MSALAIRARALGKDFGDGPLRFTALDGVTLDVPRGEMLMLSGRSGSGKTTLLSLLGCVLRPSRGQLALLGQPVEALPEAALAALRRSSIGFVFQGHNLIASLTALENVATTLELRGVAREAARREAAELLERVDLGDKRASLPAQLSGGQRQRVAIARAVAGSPPLLLADEPTAALDAQAGLTATTLMKDLCRERGATVVVVTHDDRILHLADRVVHIEDGHLLTRDHPALEVHS